MTSPAAAAPAVPLSRDAHTISVVALAHGTSHFFHLLLPPLFPVFIREFGLTYSELGLLVSVFFLISSLGQAASGFLVDRVGARPVLHAALACFVAAALLAATAQGYVGLMAAAALAGLGNAPFHPVDYTILNKRVSAPRLGHAYSAHGTSGSLGWALAPVFLLGIGEWAGNWRAGYFAASAFAAAVLAIVLANRSAVDDRLGEPAARAAGPSAGAAGVKPEHALAFLKLPTVWLCFAFFVTTSIALSAIQGFSGPALARLYGLPITTTAYVVSGFMLFSAVGMLAGGFLVARSQRLEFNIMVAMFGAAGLLMVVSAGWLPGAVAAVVVAVAGLGSGVAGPSRDLLIKRATPPGATGRVYGAVYSGLDLGFAIGSPSFGWLLDHGAAATVFSGSAVALVLGALAASLVAWRVRVPAALARA